MLKAKSLLLQKIAVATVSSTLSCAVVLQANQSKAASFSFTQGGFSTSSSRIGFSDISPGLGIPPVGTSDNVLEGTFTGEDLNGDGLISGSEVTSASINFFGLILPASVSFNLLYNDLSYGAIYVPTSTNSPLPFPVPPPPFPSINRVTINVYGSFSSISFEEDFFGIYGINGFIGAIQGRSNQLPEVTEIAPVPVPEPQESPITLVALLGVGFLFKKKIVSGRTKINCVESRNVGKEE